MAENTEINIYDHTVRIPNVYAEGHTLTALEAKVLNRCRAENIGNNQRKFIKEAIDSGDDAAVAAAVSKAEDYARSYEFTEAAAGGTSRQKLSPLEAECRRLAKDKIAKHLASVGKKKKDVDPEKYESEVIRIAGMEAIVKAAKKNLKNMDEASMELDLDVAA